jgi:hypothetical protein
MLYALVALVILIASFIFAMLGLGGGMVYVPILKWAGFPVKEVAIPLGLLLNGLNTFLALIPYTRKKLVDWKGGSSMAVTALIAAPIGAYTSRFVSVQTLLILFAFMVFLAAIRMTFFAFQKEPEKKLDSLKRTVIGVFVGSVAGFIGGLLGLGGGFIIAPILMWIGYRTKEAAATTAYVVTFSFFSGYLGHMAEGHFNLWFTVIVVLAVLVGSQAGGFFMSGKAKPKWVKQLYALVLLGVAVKLFLEATT